MDSDFSGETEEVPEVIRVFLSEIISSGRLEKPMVLMTTFKKKKKNRFKKPGLCRLGYCLGSAHTQGLMVS